MQKRFKSFNGKGLNRFIIRIGKDKHDGAHILTYFFLKNNLDEKRKEIGVNLRS